jgi:hypothetical protein
MANQSETAIQSISETRSAASQNADQLDLDGLSLLRLRGRIYWADTPSMIAMTARPTLGQPQNRDAIV